MSSNGDPYGPQDRTPPLDLPEVSAQVAQPNETDPMEAPGDAVDPGSPSWVSDVNAADAAVRPPDSTAYPVDESAEVRAPLDQSLEEAELVDESLEEGEPVALPVVYEVRPNWMLSFVCGWAGATSLSEAWALLGPGGLPLLMRNLAFFGYCSLGVGLFGFALEALRWGGSRRGAGRLMLIAVSAVATLLGVVCLVLSKDPGRRI